MNERLFGRFRLVRPLGRGGTGEVDLVRDLATGMECALKRLRSHEVADRAALAREFRLLAAFRHPAVVEVLELGHAPDGTAWYTMPYVAGHPADRALAERPEWLPAVAIEFAHGLEALHAAGIVHGDLKPPNLLVVPPGVAGAAPAGVRILDFGVAAQLVRQTGTAGFAAPEIVAGAVPNQAGDLYSLGATLYALIAGHCPFEGSTAPERLRQQASGPPPRTPLEAAGAPAELCDVVMRLLATSPSDRPSSAREARIALEQCFPSARRTLAQRLGTTVLVGRDRELGELDSWAGDLGQPILLLSGEPGIGRTLLLSAFAARTALVGRRVLRLSGSDPSFLQSLVHGLAALASEVAEPVEQLPHGGRVLGESPDSDQRERLEQQALALARQLGKPAAPILLIVDDAGELPAGDRHSVRRLALQADGLVRLLLERAGNAVPLPEERPLHLAGELKTLTLTALHRESARALMSARLARPVPTELEALIWSKASGHPGLTVEILRAAAVSRAIVEDESGLRTDPGQLARLEAPESFTQLRLQQLTSVTPAAREVILALAVCGGDAKLDELIQLAPGAEAAVIEELEAASLARSTASRRLSLNPPGLASHIAALADPVRRAALHRIASQLPGLEAGTKFRHLVGAGEFAEALNWASRTWETSRLEAPCAAAAELADAFDLSSAPIWNERAAERDWLEGRYESAATHLERALGLEPEGPRAAHRLERAAASHLRAGNLGQVVRAVELGLALDPDSGTRGRLLMTNAACRDVTGDHEAAAELATTAIELCSGADDIEGEGHAALTAATALLALERLEESEALANRAAERYRSCAHEVGLSRALQLQGLLWRRRGRMAEALRSCQAALAHARQGRSRLAVEEIHLMLAQFHADEGRTAQCREECQAALRIALEDGRGLSVALTMLNLAQLEAMSGSPRRALRLARQAGRLARRYRPAHEFLGWRALAGARRAAGHLRAAQRAAERAMGLALVHASPEDVAWCRVELCRVLAERGSHAAALAEATREGVAGAVQWTPGQALVELLAGRAALRLGDRHRAAAAVNRATAWLSGRSSPYVEAALAQLGAELALVEGRIGETLNRLDTAQERFAQIPSPHERAMAFLDLAELGVGPRTDGRAPVAEWARQAAMSFAERGNVRRQRRALELEARWLRQQLAHPAWHADRGLLERVGRLLHALTDYAELTHQAMQLAVEQFDAERGVLLVEDAANGGLEPIAQYGAKDATSEREAARFSRRLVERVMKEGTGVLVYDAPADPATATESVKTLAIRAMLCVPMFLHGRVVGAVYLDSRRVGAFGEADRRLLDGFAQLMAAALESCRASERLASENLELRREMASRVRAGLLGSSRAVQRVLPLIERAARSTSTVLLTGETGTGKDLVARLIHHTGLRRSEPFVPVNCGSLSESMLESELFGIRAGMATGVTRNEGRFQRAHRGTIFLDEIGEMPLNQQVKLLSVLTNGEVIPIGGDPIPIDVRVIAATNCDLEGRVEEGKFRADLFHRLNVMRIHMPPLRDRKGDIPELARHIAVQIARRDQVSEPELAPDFLAELMRQDWPGNVRQLANYIERRIVAGDGDILHAEAPDPDAPPVLPRVRVGPRTLRAILDAVERETLLDALKRFGGNQSKAAKALGMTEPTLRNRLLKHGIASRRKLRTG